MSFKSFADKLKDNFDEMIKTADCLFEVDVDKHELFETYLDSYPHGSNDIFRERRENDCSACKTFIRDVGKAVVIKNCHIKTIWEFDTSDDVYQQVADKMDAYIKSNAVNNVYHTNTTKIGIPVNYEQSDDGKIIEWHHFNLIMPNTLVTRESEGMFKGTHRDNKTTLKSSLDTISEESVSVALELIASNSLYRGDEWNGLLTQFLELKQAYSRISEDEINNWLWSTSFSVGTVMSKIKNHSIGVLLKDVTEGMDLESAVKRYESIVAPENYKRPKPIFTKHMLEKAETDVTELGYIDSLPRRFAEVDDITVNNLLYADRTTAKRMGVFDEMADTIPDTPKKYGRVDEISIDEFVSNILPDVSEIEMLVENRHVTNLVSLISPVNKDSKSMFKWGNNFGWAYAGNMADSSMKENVKAAGGNVTGDLRFSIQWNDVDADKNDLDAHCKECGGYEIFYSNARVKSPNGGVLDVDIIHPTNVSAVENIVYNSRSTMADGVYDMFVHCYSDRGGKSGFRAEIEFDGEVHTFDYSKPLNQNEKVHVANVTLSDGEFAIENLITSESQTRDVWGIKVNKFVHVSAICLSPNYWNGEFGNKHFMFMLKDCINPDKPNGFFNEYLTNDIYNHRKVFEALGSKMRVADCDNQLSGLGFSSTKRNDIVVRVKGNIDRIFRLKV